MPMKEACEAFWRAEPHNHFVQFYKADEPLLNRNVAGFLWDGLLKGDGLLVIATPSRLESLADCLARLGADVDMALRERQLAMLEAPEILARIEIHGEPAWERFQEAVGKALRLVRPRVADATVRVYGEVVGVLWEAGRTAAASRVEEYWNRCLRQGGITLFCGYPIDVFEHDFHDDRVGDVLHAHTYVLPTGPNGNLKDCLQRAIDELLGARAGDVHLSMQAAMPSRGIAMPEAESAILWLRSHIPDQAERILARAQAYYQASQEATCTRRADSLPALPSLAV